MRKTTLFMLFWGCLQVSGQHLSDSLSYQIETSATAGSGKYAPLWFSANRYGLASAEPNSAWLSAGVRYDKTMKHHWKLQAGAEIASGYGLTQKFIVQQAYADIAWRCLQLSIGSKERQPLIKDLNLSSGAMIEEGNARPVPQVRAEIENYVAVPGTKNWLWFKGHFSYGIFTDGNWQENHARNQLRTYVKNTLYHSKAAMFKIGNTEKRPWDLEIGLLVSSQFAGEQYKWNADAKKWELFEMPDGFKEFIKMIIPTQGGDNTPNGDQVNVSGNFIGSWNAAFSYYWKDWKFRIYYEHMFEDESQMFMQYGRWKDGHIGLEITCPENPWISKILWEGLATKDQTGPILFDGFVQSLPDHQISAADDYYNNYFYQGWQHWGMGMGNPLLPGPIYNENGSLMFSSNRTKSNHFGISGRPTKAWSYRILLSEARHWGTYNSPFDQIKRQFSSLYEISYQPLQLQGWQFSASLGLDRGTLLGNNTAGMITVKKEGWLWKK